MVIVDDSGLLKKSLAEKGFEIFDFFDNLNTYSVSEFLELPLQRRNDLLLVDTQSLMNSAEKEKFYSVMNTYVGVFFFYEHKNEKAPEWLQDQAAFLNKIIGEFALPMPQLSWSILSNQLQFFWNLIGEQKRLQSHMAKFSRELDQVLSSAEGQMLKAKRIHETLVPKRHEDIKGVKFMSKYSSGDGGGEFYDLHQEGQKVFQIFISSQSYLISSALLGLLSQAKEKGFSASMFLRDAQQEIDTINGSKKKKAEATVSIFELDTMTLDMVRHGSASVEVLSSSGDSATSPLRLKRGDRFALLSAGFIANWKGLHPGNELRTFFSGKEGLSTSELIDELFISIGQQKENFLLRDATVVVMEVHRHGIHKV